MAITFEEIKEKEKTYLMRTYARKPVLFVRGFGSRLWDDTGKEYIDFVSGLGACVTGHVHGEVLAAIARQSAQLIQVSNWYFTIPQVLLAETLIKNSFADRVFFCNSGAEANEGAMKLARKYMREKGEAERYEIITALRSFHGRTLATLTATGAPEKAEPYKPLPEGFKHVPFNDIRALREAVGSRTCAIMLEPIQGESGVYVAEKKYLQEVRKICDREGILFILDEVQTGMGRTGFLFAYEGYGIEPDIMTIAKGLASGLPIGAFLAREEVAKAFGPGDHGTTFGGGPVPCAAALATLDVLFQENLVENVATVGQYFKERLGELKERKSGVVEVRGMGFMLALELKEERAEELVLRLLERGLVVNNIGGKILRFLPPLSISKREIDTLMDNLMELI